MKIKKILLLLVSCILSMASASAESFRQISQSQAKSMMDSGKEIIILDVRSRSEFAAGHIENSICIPVEEILSGTKELEKLGEKDSTVLVYCRSGRRSKMAANHLASMGYSQILEFGGLMTWPYGTVK